MTLDDTNFSLLIKLRDKPLIGDPWQQRLHQVDALLDQPTLNRTIEKLRWPKGIRCPRCHSVRIRLLLHKEKAIPSNELPQYLCETCDRHGFQAIFSAISDLPETWLYYLRQLLLCWFLQRVCSISQLSTKFGLSILLLKQFMQWYEQRQALSDELEKNELLEKEERLALKQQDTVDGKLTKNKAGRLIVNRDDFEWDAEEVRILKERRMKLRE